MLHVVLGEAVDHRHVECVHSRRPDAEENLALPGFRSLRFSNAPGLAELIDGECTHAAAPFTQGLGNPRPARSIPRPKRKSSPQAPRLVGGAPDDSPLFTEPAGSPIARRVPPLPG